MSVVLAVILLVFCTGCGSNESGNISNPAQSNVAIPNSVKKIYYDAFVDCTANITYKGKTYTPDNYDALYEAARGY